MLLLPPPVLPEVEVVLSCRIGGCISTAVASAAEVEQSPEKKAVKEIEERASSSPTCDATSNCLSLPLSREKLEFATHKKKKKKKKKTFF